MSTVSTCASVIVFQSKALVSLIGARSNIACVRRAIRGDTDRQSRWSKNCRKESPAVSSCSSPKNLSTIPPPEGFPEIASVSVSINQSRRSISRHLLSPPGRQFLKSPTGSRRRNCLESKTLSSRQKKDLLFRNAFR